jgi:DNA-binding response OmpR family regulator
MAKILLIDDDPFISDMYILKFREHGFEIETAKDGKEGLEKIKKYPPDLILLDIVMPAMDGFEVLQELKKEGTIPKAKVILLTNLGQKEDVEKGMKLGADDYIIKAHFTPSEVVEKVKQLLQK